MKICTSDGNLILWQKNYHFEVYNFDDWRKSIPLIEYLELLSIGWIFFWFDYHLENLITVMTKTVTVMKIIIEMHIITMMQIDQIDENYTLWWKIGNKMYAVA